MVVVADSDGWQKSAAIQIPVSLLLRAPVTARRSRCCSKDITTGSTGLPGS